MYAIVDIAGQQFKVEKDQKIFVHRLDGEEGDEVQFDKVLLIENDDAVIVGEPVIAGALVSAKIVAHLKGDKTIVFKKKRRKGFKVKKGHRQLLTQLLIEDIVEKEGVKKERKKAATKPSVEKPVIETAPEKTVEKKEAKKAATPETKKGAAKEEGKKPAKKAPEKKAATPKPVAKKILTKKKKSKK